MSYGSPVMRQHVVEFIVGTGVVTDGVTDATSLTGPWTFVVPPGVSTISISGCGSGGSGGGGYNSTSARAGGGGGASAVSMSEYPATVIPNSNLIITVGAASVGGIAGAFGTEGNSTYVSGLCPRSWATAFIQTGISGGTLSLHGGGRGSLGGASAGGGGGQTASPNTRLGLLNATGSSGTNNIAGTPGSPSMGGELISNLSAFGGKLLAHGGQGGGGASTTPTNNGGVGQSWKGSGGRAMNSGHSFQNGHAGNTDGSISYGGGGSGGPSAYGLPGDGGSGNAAGSSATGFGAGGGGGGGNAAGGGGSPGYVCFTYWSVD